MTTSDPGTGPQAPGEHGPAYLPACPSCHALIGELHSDSCTIAWCAALGLQRYAVCDTEHGCRTDPLLDCRTTWSGLYPGFAECRELGWFAQLTPHGWANAGPATPGAIEDLNRLITTCVWDRQQGRYVLPADSKSAVPEARQAQPGERTGKDQ